MSTEEKKTSDFDKREAVYLVNDSVYLHLKEASDKKKTGWQYETFAVSTKTQTASGFLTLEQIGNFSGRTPIMQARTTTLNEIGLCGVKISPLALRTLDKIPEARRSYRRAHKDDPPDHSIRFITSSYDELFRISDGGIVQINRPDHTFTAKCEYLDDYHTRIGGLVFHVCQFAEMMENSGSTVEPEPEITADHASWQIGLQKYLSIQACEDGWDFTLYDKNFGILDGGQYDLPEASMNEIREMILTDLGLEKQNRTPVDYDMVEEKAAEIATDKASEIIDERKPDHSVLNQLKQMKTEADHRPHSTLLLQTQKKEEAAL